MLALGRSRQAKGREYYDGDVNLPAFLTAKNLKPFISKELEVTSSQVEFKPLKGARAFGYPAELLPSVCGVFLDADEASALTSMQKHGSAVSFLAPGCTTLEPAFAAKGRPPQGLCMHRAWGRYANSRTVECYWCSWCMATPLYQPLWACLLAALVASWLSRDTSCTAT